MEKFVKSCLHLWISTLLYDANSETAVEEKAKVYNEKVFATLKAKDPSSCASRKQKLLEFVDEATKMSCFVQTYFIKQHFCLDLH